MSIQPNILCTLFFLFVISPLHPCSQADIDHARALCSLSIGTNFHHEYYGGIPVDQSIREMVKEIKQLLGIPSARTVHLFYLNAVGHACFGIENLVTTSNALFIDKTWFCALPVEQQRFLLAHELAHMYAKDVGIITAAIACAGGLLGYSIIAAFQKKCSCMLPVLIAGIVVLLIPSYGRYTEERADRLAVQALGTCEGGISCLMEWQHNECSQEDAAWWQQCLDALFATHPTHAQRLQALKNMSKHTYVR